MQDNLTNQEKAKLVLGLHEETMEPWDLDKANILAKSEGITLTDAHIAVIQYIRTAFEKHGAIKHARTLTQALEAKFATRGGLKYLYTLFPQGPVSQGCKIAGIPLPPDSRSQSFGTTF